MNHYKASLEQIELQKSLDYYTQQEASNILKDRIATLAHNGKISLSGLDFSELCRLYGNKTIDIASVNKMLVERKGYSSLEARCEELSSYGLIITRKVQQGLEYFVEAMRP